MTMLNLRKWLIERKRHWSIVRTQLQKYTVAPKQFAQSFCNSIFPLQNGNNDPAQISGSLWESHEIMYIVHLSPCSGNTHDELCLKSEWLALGCKWIVFDWEIGWVCGLMCPLREAKNHLMWHIEKTEERDPSSLFQQKGKGKSSCHFSLLLAITCKCWTNLQNFHGDVCKWGHNSMNSLA